MGGWVVHHAGARPKSVVVWRGEQGERREGEGKEKRVALLPTPLTATANADGCSADAINAAAPSTPAH